MIILNRDEFSNNKKGSKDIKLFLIPTPHIKNASGVKRFAHSALLQSKNSLLTADPFIFLPSTYTEKKYTFMSSKINKKNKKKRQRLRQGLTFHWNKYKTFDSLDFKSKLQNKNKKNQFFLPF